MQKVIIENAAQIHYQVIGSGKPVVLIHGFAENADVWRNQVDYLKDHFQLIIPDLPGSGHSSMTNDMSMEGMAATIKNILDKEAITNCAMIGHSMGGYITLAFAEKYPELLNSFGLFHSTAYADSDEKKALRKKGIAFIEEYGALEFLKTSTPNLFSSKSKDEKPGLIDEHIAGLHNFSATALVSYYTAMMNRPDRTHILTKTTVPVLFVLGEYDNAVPLNDGLQQSHLPGKSYIHIFHESGHMGMLEEAATSNRILDEFLLET